MRYGLPYIGSKNAIAEWIVNLLPEGDVLCDLFCGGCAITHCALLQNKYKKIIINDINDQLPKFFVECINGLHTVEKHTEWVSREKFFAEKENNILIKLLWSFGNNGYDYLYGRNIEEYKRSLHECIFEGNAEKLKPYGYDIKVDKNKRIYDRYLDIRKQIKEKTKERSLTSLESLERLQNLQNLKRPQDLQNLQNLQSLEGLQNLQNLEGLQNLEVHSGDYQEVKIPEGAIIYCDIPYACSDRKAGYGVYFDYDRFYKWADEQENIFISEYDMPDNFVCIAEKKKTVLCGNANGKYANEKIFTNRKTFKKRKIMPMEQLSLFY